MMSATGTSAAWSPLRCSAKSLPVRCAIWMSPRPIQPMTPQACFRSSSFVDRAAQEERRSACRDRSRRRLRCRARSQNDAGFSRREPAPCARYRAPAGHQPRGEGAGLCCRAGTRAGQRADEFSDQIDARARRHRQSRDDESRRAEVQPKFPRRWRRQSFIRWEVRAWLFWSRSRERDRIERYCASD